MHITEEVHEYVEKKIGDILMKSDIDPSEHSASGQRNFELYDMTL